MFGHILGLFRIQTAGTIQTIIRSGTAIIIADFFGVLSTWHCTETISVMCAITWSERDTVLKQFPLCAIMWLYWNSFRYVCNHVTVLKQFRYVWNHVISTWHCTETVSVMCTVMWSVRDTVLKQFLSCMQSCDQNVTLYWNSFRKCNHVIGTWLCTEIVSVMNAIATYYARKGS